MRVLKRLIALRLLPRTYVCSGPPSSGRRPILSRNWAPKPGKRCPSHMASACRRAQNTTNAAPHVYNATCRYHMEWPEMLRGPVYPIAPSVSTSASKNKGPHPADRIFFSRQLTCRPLIHMYQGLRINAKLSRFFMVSGFRSYFFIGCFKVLRVVFYRRELSRSRLQHIVASLGPSNRTSGTNPRLSLSPSRLKPLICFNAFLIDSQYYSLVNLALHLALSPAWPWPVSL